VVRLLSKFPCCFREHQLFVVSEPCCFRELEWGQLLNHIDSDHLNPEQKSE